MANTAINVTELDFDKIKTGIKDYISAQPDFTDYNFEGSTINLLIDMLAYNTYQNAFYTSMVGNEMFLDSAQLRGSVVSRAKMLGYIPKSSTGAHTTLDVTVTPNDDPVEVVIKKGTEWISKVDGVSYTFATPEAYTLKKDDDYSGKIKIVEGKILNHTYEVSTTKPVKYIIPNANVDIDSIEIEVYKSSTNPSTEVFNRADDIITVTNQSPIYFIQEIEGEKYEVYFGDGVLGKALENGNLVSISYRVNNGAAGNNIDVFTNPSSLGNYDTFTVNVETRTAGGDEVESTESVRYNAPKSYETQNRAVLPEDYKRIILDNFSDIQSVRAWGGQDNDPPVYGKVYIACKPKSGIVLSDQRKAELTTALKQYNVAAIHPEFIDPTYVYVKPSVTVNWDSSKTLLSSGEVKDKVIKVIQDFEEDNMGTYENQKFRFSRFVDVIDECEQSIHNNNTTIVLQKDFNPNVLNKTNYTIYYAAPLIPGQLQSTAFYLNGKKAYFDDDSEGAVRSYYILSGAKVYINNKEGTIDYNKGIINLTSFQPESFEGDFITVTATSTIKDYTAQKYQLMLMRSASVTMYDEHKKELLQPVTVNTMGSVTLVNEDTAFASTTTII